jgi:hypothetical protein
MTMMMMWRPKPVSRAIRDGFGSRWGLGGGARQAGTSRPTHQQMQQHIRVLEEYHTQLQSQLVQVMHKMRVLSNQIRDHGRSTSRSNVQGHSQN